MKLYCFSPLPGIALVPWFERGADGTLPSHLKGVRNPFANTQYTETLEEADVACVPNNLKKLTPEQDTLLRRYVDEALKAEKRIFLFSCGDFTDQFRFDPRAYVFRYSTYRSALTPQDLVMQTLVEDYGKEGIFLREKAETPTVSFCGQAGYATTKQWVKYYIKVFLYMLISIGKPSYKARIIGVYWRRRLIRACKHSSRVITNFIIRRSFSAALRTIELDPAEARRAFITSIVESDFVLAPKGDGNYSNRFLETLALGRIPVLLDTEMVLPFADEVDYEAIMVRVPMECINETPDIIRAWYDAHDARSWCAAQERAREVFETRLRFDAFFIHFFGAVLPKLPLDASERTVVP